MNNYFFLVGFLVFIFLKYDKMCYLGNKVIEYLWVIGGWIMGDEKRLFKFRKLVICLYFYEFINYKCE